MSDLNIVEVVPVTLEVHPNADSLSLVKVYDNYVVCVRTADWIGVDRGAYIPPDNIVPADRPEFAFLAGKWRIKAKKLRGIVSQGLLIPAPPNSNIGDDVTEYFGVVRYVPDIDIRMNAGNRGTPPPVPGLKYDVESWFKYSSMFDDGEEVVFSEKLHGTSLKVTYQNDQWWVSSRGFYRRQDDEDGIYWRAVTENSWILSFCFNNPGVFVHAEIFGWVQDLKYDAKPGQLMVRVFDVFDGVKFWDFEQFAAAFTEDQRVPVVYRGPYSKELVLKHMNGKSTLASHVREGIVIRPVVERFCDRRGFPSRVNLKAVSPDYLERA
jgi:RNA ligase (TIGR02306 family)